MKRKLNRLYDFEDGGEEDEVLLEKIQTIRNQIKVLESQLKSEEQKKKAANRLDRAADILKTLDETWPHMTEKERQSVCRELIERVEVFKNGRVDVYLKLRSYMAQ